MKKGKKKTNNLRPIKNIMVCLDLTEMDDLLIQYTAHLCRLLEDAKKVFFVHNIRFDNAEDVQEILSKLDKSLGKFVDESLEEKIETFFQNVPTQTEFEIIVEEESSTPATLARLAKIYQINLMIVGKKISYKGSGLAVEKLLRIPHFNASLLLVPETTYHQFRNILVPIDFSKTSKVAIEIASYFRHKANAQLSCLHVFSFPSFYFPFMMVRDLEPVLREQVEKRWKKFAKELHQIGASDVGCELSFNWEKNIAQTIYDHAVRNNKDLIIISSKGKGGFPSFVIGSVALQLVQYDLHIPLLVVKKGEYKEKE